MRTDEYMERRRQSQKVTWGFVGAAGALLVFLGLISAVMIDWVPFWFGWLVAFCGAGLGGWSHYEWARIDGVCFKCGSEHWKRLEPTRLDQRNRECRTCGAKWQAKK